MTHTLAILRTVTQPKEVCETEVVVGRQLLEPAQQLRSMVDA